MNNILSSLLDAAVELISPSTAVARARDRVLLSRFKARGHAHRSSDTYAAAKTGRLTNQSWNPGNTNVNEIIGASSPTVRARVRQLVRDFPYFSNAVNQIVTHVVGPGIMFQSKIQDPTGGLNQRAIQQVEDAFSWWADEADVAKKLHFYEIMQLAKRQDVESGEFIIVKRWRPQDGRFLPFCLQIYEADWLTTQFDTHASSQWYTMQASTNGPYISQGIEYDPWTGQVVAFHFVDPDAFGKPIRIKAEDVIHGFDTLRPGQLRGISPFAPGVMLAGDLDDYMQAEIDAAKMAAKYLAFVRRPSKQLSIMAGADPSAEYDSATGRYMEDLENAIIEYLQPGEEVQLAHNPRPGTSFPPFVRLVLTMLSATTGVPYELLSGDYQGLNYSTSRTSRNDFSAHVKPIAQRHIRQFCKPTFYAFLDYAALSGVVDLPGYFEWPYFYRRADWQPPGLESVDPFKETRASVEAIKNRIRSPQEVIRARGRDPEEVLKEIQQWQAWMSDLGIAEPEATSTALASNTASILDAGEKALRVIKNAR